jgi:methyl-accepting chemotaxis protein
MSFSNIKIGRKLAISFATVVLIVVVLAVTVVKSLSDMEMVNNWNVHSYQVLDQATNLVSGMVNQETGVRGFLVSGDQKFLDPYTSGQTIFSDAMTALKQLTSDNPAQQKRLDDINATAADWNTNVGGAEVKLMGNIATWEQARALETSGAGKTSMDKIRSIVTEFSGIERQLLDQRTAAANAAAQFTKWAMIGGSVLTALLAILIGWMLTRGIAMPIIKMTGAMDKLAAGDTGVEIPAVGRKDEVGQMADAVQLFKDAAIEKLKLGAEAEHARLRADEARTSTERERASNEASRAEDARQQALVVETLGKGLARLADGDLSATIDTQFAGELDAVRLAFNEAVEKFASIVTQLRGTSGALKTATGEILSGANDLAERTTKQAAAVEETSAALEQLANTVTENATRAETARTKASAVSQAAEATGEVMGQANDAMERISSSSTKISNIIGMIDDIAFQTNLLALNASVEAARAGDAGKGFAVVAIEVRRLAQSAAGASSEVKTLIEQSASEVSGGTKLVDEATQKVRAMLEGLRESSALMDGIAQATQEQSSTISQVTTAVRQIDEMTQHNAALVEETNAAIEQTEGQANELDRIVDVFIVDAAARRPASSRTAQNPAAQNPAIKGNMVKAMQEKVKSAARSYLSHGNAALKDDWSE